MKREELLAAYRDGRRRFHEVKLDGFDLKGETLIGASFYCGSLRGVDLTDADLTHIQFKGADLSGASLQGANVNATDLIGAKFVDADLRDADFTGAAMARADCTNANMERAYLGNASLPESILGGARLTGIELGHTYLTDLDLRPFCDTAEIRHFSPSYIDYRSVVRSYSHPTLKRFMRACGIPQIFTDYMIDCAKAIDQPVLRTLMQSTLISYGQPDEAFARSLYDELSAHGVTVFFFPESATLGERVGNEVFRQLHDHDRVILVCSRGSLNREGVINEIQETLDREARDGGASYLLPIMLDDYVLTEWHEIQPELAKRVKRRVIGDFRGTDHNSTRFETAMQRLMDALKKHRPGGNESGDA